MKGMILMAVVTMAAAAAAQSKPVHPNVKVGLWEQTITVNRTGAMGLPESLLSRLTPEQRARVEAKMKADEANGSSHKRTTQSCLTQKDLDNWDIYKTPDSNCHETVLKATSTAVDAKWECSAENGFSGTGTLHIDVDDTEHAHGTVHTIIDSNGHHMVVDSTMTSRWIGSDCSKMRKGEY